MSDHHQIAEKILQSFQHSELKIATAESCTGGMVSAALTSVPGSSAVFDRGFVTYSNEAKRDQLHVSPDTLAEFGAVSEQTAIEMAVGALRASAANIAISITGVAGPDGGSREKPVGLVYFGLAWGNPLDCETKVYKQVFPGTRAEIREAALSFALGLLYAPPF
jgi:nicotinamide-nucleotide amidase